MTFHSDAMEQRGPVETDELNIPEKLTQKLWAFIAIALFLDSV